MREQFLLFPVILLQLINFRCEGATSFNEAFAASIQARLETMLSGPGIRVLNPLETAFNSQWDYMFSGDFEEGGRNHALIDFVSSNATQNYIWTLMKPSSSDDGNSGIDFVFIGLENGLFLGYNQGVGTNLNYVEMLDGNSSCPAFNYTIRCRRSYGGNSTDQISGEKVGPPTFVRDYDPRYRPWYIQSMESDSGSIWTSPYVFTEDGALGITATRRIQSSTGQILGVSGVDYLLVTLDDTLVTENEATGDNFVIYVVENNGYLIASSQAGGSVQMIDGVNTQVYSTESSNSIIAATSQQILKSKSVGGGGGWASSNGSITTIDVEGSGLYWTQVRKIENEFGLIWFVVVVEQVSCDRGYYPVPDYKDKDCEKCPTGGTCEGGSMLPYPQKGYWIDRSSYEDGGDVFECIFDTCVGFPSREDRIQKMDSDVNCWTLSDFNNSVCDPDVLMCEKGSTGPLCGTCDEGYHYNSGERKCTDCVSSINFFLTIMTVFFVVIVIWSVVKVWERTTDNNVAEIVVAFMKNVESGNLKVIWVTYQIIVSAVFNLGVEFPAPFPKFVGVLSFFSFDFLALHCMMSGGESTVYMTIYLWCILPIALALIILVIGVIRMRLEVHNSTRRKEIKYNHVWMFLFLSYLVLPAVSNKQLSVFNCVELSGQFYLKSDTSVDCRSTSYFEFRSVVIVFILIYQMIPIMWMMVLFRKRNHLNPPRMDESLAMYIRENDPKLTSIRFLFKDYKPKKWWFEVAEMYRRIVFIGVTPLVSAQASIRTSFGLILSVLSIMYYRDKKPFRSASTNSIANIAQISIFVTYYAAVSLSTGAMVNFGLEDYRLGLFLILFNVLIVVFAVRSALKRSAAQKKALELKAFNATNYEWAIGFSEGKFKTTLDAVWRHSIPSSHALVFFYTSFEKAKSVMKSGIPGSSRFNGIPLTLRPPHQTIEADFNVFGEPSQFLSNSVPRREFPNEHCFVLSLPRRSLSALPGFKEDIGLCMVSNEVLSALRPTNYDEVVDPTPWEHHFNLLPPKCIIRSFLIMKAIETQKQVRSQSAVATVAGAAKTATAMGKRLSHLTSHHQMIGVFHNHNFEEEDDMTKTTDMLDADFHFHLSQCEKLSGNVSPGSSRRITISSFDAVVISKPRRIISAKWFGVEMASIREKAAERNLIPLYHYTSPNIAPLILKSGLRMSSQGQGDGGVYVSTQGPASYDLGTERYEENIIKDCFGIERINEYKGKGKLDVVIIYGCESSVLEQTPGGRANAKMVSKDIFEHFSMKHPDGSYFLRPDRILGMFVVDHSNPPSANTSECEESMIVEKKNDERSILKLHKAEASLRENNMRINKGLEFYWDSIHGGSHKKNSNSAPRESNNLSQNKKILQSGVKKISKMRDAIKEMGPRDEKEGERNSGVDKDVRKFEEDTGKKTKHLFQQRVHKLNMMRKMGTASQGGFQNEEHKRDEGSRVVGQSDPSRGFEMKSTSKSHGGGNMNPISNPSNVAEDSVVEFEI